MKATSIDLSTPAKRKRLAEGKIHWNTLGSRRSGKKLGYRRGPRGGSWLAKAVKDGEQPQEVIGTADDEGHGEGTLSYAEALAKALAWTAARHKRIAEGDPASEKVAPVTVGDALEAYIVERARRDPVNGRNAGHRLHKHALSDKAFTEVRMERYQASDMLNWRERLPGDLALGTVNRMITDVQAALNAHIAANWRNLPATLKEEVRIGAKRIPNAQRARHALLSDADVRRVVESAYGIDADLGNLVLVLASTGARFRQVSGITVADVLTESARIMVPVSAKGRGVKQRPFIPVAIGEDVLNRLKPLLTARAGHEPLLQHWLGTKGFGHAANPLKREPWRGANQMFKGWVRALAAAGVEYVEPYALRHSSIVRMLRAGLPVRLVAAAHDTSSTMIERHYAQFILDAADELARKAITPLVSAGLAPLRVVN